jgi:hypothetical protein
MKTEIVIFKELTTEEKLTEIEKQSEKFQGLVVDMNVDSQRKEVKESAKVINGILKKVDRFRIDEKAAYAAKVEAEAAHIKSRLETANAPLTNLIDGYNEERKRILEAEKERAAKVEAAFTALNDSAMEAIGQSSSVIETIIEDMESYDFDPAVLKSRTDEFVKKHGELMAKLQAMLDAQLASEKMQAQQEEFEAMKEKERLEAEAKERAIREAKIAEDARIEAEKRHKAQLAENEERERLSAIQRKEQAAIDAKAAEDRAAKQAQEAARMERERIEAEQEAERVRIAKLEANKRLVGAVRGELKTQLMDNAQIDEATAKRVVLALSKLERITINYGEINNIKAAA